jgi:hypothetical protein
LKTEDGEIAHTACVAFGIDRVAVAVFAAHGLKIDDWPRSTVAALRL